MCVRERERETWVSLSVCAPVFVPVYRNSPLELDLKMTITMTTTMTIRITY